MGSEFFVTHAAEIAWGFAIFGTSLLLSSLAAIFVILRLPENYFYSSHVESFWTGRPRWQYLLGMALKNALGVGLVVLGLLLSLPGVPGQGLLTMFIGIVLLDLPGKRAIERRVMSRPAILRTCNRIRRRFGKPPILPLDAHLPANGKARGETIGTRDDVHGRVK